MTRIYVLVEGQTEEVFMRDLMVPHYARTGLYLTPIIVNTSPGHKGGVVNYAKVRRQIVRLCKQDTGAHVTTLFDLYALPNDFPGKNSSEFQSKNTGVQKAEFIEVALARDINEPNFFPFLIVHEFEALLFAQPEKFSVWTDDTELVSALGSVLLEHQTPEDINDDPQTAPSKRILRLMPEYEKSFHGPLIACDIGLDVIRRSCPHFESWLRKLEQLVAD